MIEWHFVLQKSMKPRLQCAIIHFPASKLIITE